MLTYLADTIRTNLLLNMVPCHILANLNSFLGWLILKVPDQAVCKRVSAKTNLFHKVAIRLFLVLHKVSRAWGVNSRSVCRAKICEYIPNPALVYLYGRLYKYALLVA